MLGSFLLRQVERGRVPDALARAGIRRLLRERLAEERVGGCEARRERFERLLEELRSSPIALETDAANAQHYEVPAELFRMVLGPRLKYSAGLWEPAARSLQDAEEAMLRLTAARAGIEDGMDVLDLGCGWGSLALWVAERHPRCRVLAVSNSSTQRRFVLEAARDRGLDNVDVMTADINDFRPGRRFDRVVSVEMFEHMRNYRELLRRIAGWLRPDGRLFVHLFCHRDLAYRFEDRGADDWMARNFFSGGLMPSDDLLTRFQDDLAVARRWTVDGRHYARTLLAWLGRLDGHRAEVRALFAGLYGEAHADLWVGRWRLFFLACAELFGYADGQEWYVAHYLFRPRAAAGGLDREASAA